MIHVKIDKMTYDKEIILKWKKKINHKSVIIKKNIYNIIIKKNYDSQVKAVRINSRLLLQKKSWIKNFNNK